MIAPETRVELKHIQSELKKPLPAPQHEIRDLPGGGRKWVYLRWQTIRERLDEVCPEWVIDYSEIQYLGNDAICRCGITILGIRKEALASVPISILSSGGKEMSRGSAADRLAAEALKNSAEVWGVGRYLDDQEFTIRYLWERMAELSGEVQGEIRRLSEQYKIDKGARSTQPKSKNETGFINAISGVESSSLITEGQRKRLLSVAKNELKLDDEQVKDAQKHFGFEKTELISQDKYELLINYLRTKVAKPLAVNQDLYPANNDIIRQVRGYTKHDPTWILSQCKHYGYDRPGAMPPEYLEKLVADMCVDWSLTSGVMSDRSAAYTSIQGAIAFASGAGQPLVDAVLKWLARHQSNTPVVS